MPVEEEPRVNPALAASEFHGRVGSAGPDSSPAEAEGLAQSCVRAQARFPQRPDWPDPQSQSLSRSYGSRLPISLTHINLSTRGSEPRRPDAEMGTVCVETGSPIDNGDRLSPTAAASDCDPCDFLTYIFHGLALVHGTPQELRRSTATVWFIIPSSPSRFI